MSAALLLVIASAANAAGLGKLVVLSAMGEPFRAEIDLLPDPAQFPDTRITLTARLASPEIYTFAGFRYNPALTGTRLNIRSNPNGRAVIEIISARPLNEPFVYLLVELESNATRMMRSYTALLDPQGYRSSREVAAAEFLPVMVPVAVSAVLTAVVRVPAAERSRVTARQTPRQEQWSNADAKALAGMLERVAALELAVEQLQRQWKKTDVVAAVKSTTETSPAPNPEAVKASPDAPAGPAAAPGRPAVAAPPPPPLATVEAAPRPAPVKDSLLNEALLALVIGLLIISAWLSWVVWGPPSREQAPAR